MDNINNRKSVIFINGMSSAKHAFLKEAGAGGLLFTEGAGDAFALGVCSGSLGVLLPLA